MKLLSFLDGNQESWGAVVENGVVDLGSALPQYPTLADFIASDDFANRDRSSPPTSPTLKLSDIKYLPVIPRPEKIVCAVRNYLDHHNEAVAFGMKREITEFPPIFLRVWRSQVAHNAPVIRPKVSTHLDWEGELAVVIGKGGRHIPEAEAMESRRGLLDLQRRQRARLAAPCAADRLRQEFRRHRPVRTVAGHAGRDRRSHQTETGDARQRRDGAILRHLAC